MHDDQLQDLLKSVALYSDRQAYKKLYMLYYNKLFCVVKSFVKSIEGAEEVVDDTFLSIWLKRTQLTEIQNFTAYIYTAARNKSLNYIANMKIHEHVNLDDMEIDIADLSPNGEDQLLITDLTESLNISIAKLPEQCRLVFKLVKEDGYKYREAAELLNISVKTVEYHIGNALKKIAEGLTPSQKCLAARPIKNTM